MKKIKKFVSLMSAFALVFAISGISSLKAQAASPTTYFIFFNEGSWSYQVGDSNYNPDARQFDPELIMSNSDTTHPQDGDIIVVKSLDDSTGEGLILNLGNINLSNVTIAKTAPTVVVSAASINECYILGDANAAINGNVANAYVYDRAHANFNNNISNLYITAESDGDSPEIAVLGTVGYARYVRSENVDFEFSNFAKGNFEFSYGNIKSDAVYDQASGSAAAAPVSTTAPASDASSQTSSSDAAQSTSAVSPKTGEVLPTYVYFICTPLVFLGLYKVLKRG
jgi:hypothetical protein